MKYIVWFGLLFLPACASVEDETGRSPVTPFDNSDLPQWLIPKNEVVGATEKDAIPSIDEPKFVSVSEAAWLNDNDWVLLLRHGDELRVYPYRILDWHEVVNDEVGGDPVCVTFCPLTGSGVAFSASFTINDITVTTEFGVSGLLYNSNLIYYDRQTGSYWSQMLNKSVNGPLRGFEPPLLMLLETVFSTVRELYPDARVLSRETGIYRSSQYSNSTYEDYRIDDVLYYPLSVDDNRLSRKERVLSFFAPDIKKAYRFRDFSDSVDVVNDRLGDMPVVVAGERSRRLIVGFERRHPVNGLELNMTAVRNSLPVIMQDQFGNRYDLFGTIVNGVWAGQRLNHAGAVTAYWFSWASMFPGLEIYAAENN